MPDVNCIQNTMRMDRAYLERFNAKIAERRIPLFGTIDLTRACNLNCIHCYRGTPSASEKGGLHETGTEKWKQIIDEITAAGCLHLLITGGEPLLRKDFSEIYQHAVRNGMLVTVFSNATCVSDEILALFSDLPPQAVEISLYGASAKTCERITRVHGSFDRCMQGIERLRHRGIRVALKTILMTANRHEFAAIQDIARQLGVKFRFDASIFPCLDGDPSPIDYRVSPETAVQLEMADPERRRRWVDHFRKTRNAQYPETLYICGAGTAAFYIDPAATLRPCLMTQDPEFDLRKGSFAEGWHTVIAAIRDRKNTIDACRNCGRISLCGYCPAFFRLEKGDETVRSEYLCELGEHRQKAIHQYLLERGEDERESYESEPFQKAV